LNPDSFVVSEALAQVYIARTEYNNSYIAIAKVEKLAVTPDQRSRFLLIRAQSLDQINQPDAAYRDWTELLNMPVGVTTSDMRQEAQSRLAALRTPTPTITLTSSPSPTPTRTPKISPTVTLTPRPTQTFTTPNVRPTDTRQPTATSIP
jgi:hypothetical protein